MKHITTIITLLFCLTLSAQDTTYVTHNGTGFIVVTRTVSASGSYTETGRFIGDTSQLVDYTEGVFVRGVSALQQAAAVVLGADRYLEQAIREDQRFQAAFNVSPLTRIQQQTDSTFLVDEWMVQSVEGTSPIFFNRSSQGNLEVTIDSIKHPVYLVNSTMRVTDFNIRGSLVFYKLNPNTWVDSNKQYAIVRTKVNWIPWRPE